MKEWLIRLKGDGFGLQELPELFSSPDLAVFKEGENYFLKSERFNSLADAGEVQKAARDRIDAMNTAAHFHFGDFCPVQDDGYVIGVDENGKRQRHVLLSAAIMSITGLKATLTVTRADGTIEPDPRPNHLERLVALADSDKNVRDALWFFRQEDCVGLWKVLEVVKAEVGGEDAIISKGWTTRDELECFKGTVNHPLAMGDGARHARRPEKQQPPPKPMTLAEAKSFIKTMLDKWLRSCKGL